MFSHSSSSHFFSRSVIIHLTIFALFIYYPTLINSQLNTHNQWFEDTFDDFFRNNGGENGGASADIQVSTCKISSKQLVATAQATAARVLKGVCNPSELEDRFQNMETQMLEMGEQMNSLKSMMIGLEDRFVEQDLEIKRQFRRLMHLISGLKVKSGRGSTVIDNNNYEPAFVPEVRHRGQDVVNDDDDLSPNYSGGVVGPRSDEIATYNSTIRLDNGRRIFSYYWIVTGMSEKLKSWPQRRVLRSNSFYLYPGGYRMYLKVIPRYSGNTMYIHAGVTKGVYDDSLQWPFHFKLHASVLNQAENDPAPTSDSLDLKSRLWNPQELCSGSNWRKPVFGDNQECVGLGFPHDLINNYIWSDRIIIKLTVFLD